GMAAGISVRGSRIESSQTPVLLMVLRGHIPPHAVIDCQLAGHLPSVLKEQPPLLIASTGCIRRGLIGGVVVAQQPAGEAEARGKSTETICWSEGLRGCIGSGRQRDAGIVLYGRSLVVDFGAELSGVLAMNPGGVGVIGGFVVVVNTLDLSVGPHVLHPSVKGTRHAGDGGELTVLDKASEPECRGIEIEERRAVAEGGVVIACAEVQQDGRRHGSVVV